MKLSEAQIDALCVLRELGAMADYHAVVFIGKSRKRTLQSLERQGLVKWYPTPEHWKLTAEGRAEACKHTKVCQECGGHGYRGYSSHPDMQSTCTACDGGGVKKFQMTRHRST